MVAAPAPLIPSTAATRLPDGAALAGVNGPVIDGMQASPTVPSASVLQYGTYDRVGNDLVIHGPAGEQVVVENYFHGHTPATLHAPGGFELAGKTVMALAGEHAPVQVADAGGNQQLAQAASPIGTADKLNGTVTVTRVDGSVVTLQAGDVVYQGDVLQTADGSSIGLVMADGTELSLGSKGRIVLDEMVYDAGNGTGHSSVSLVSGVFSFVSGQIAKSSPDGMQIKTPVATIGIRGTSGTIQLGDLALDNDSQIRVILIPDPNGTVGEIQITTMDGRTSTLNTAFNGLNIGQSTLQSFTMTVHDFVGQYGSVIQNLRSDFSSSLGPINNTAPEQNNAPQNNTPAPGENKGSDASGTEKDSSQQASSSSGADSNQNAQDSSSAPIKVVLTDTIVTKTTTSAFSTTTDNDTQTAGDSSGSSTGSSSTGQSGSTGTSTGNVFNNNDNSLNSSTSSGSGTSGGSTGSGSSGGDSSSVSYNGSVIDPHVSGATVFIDYDGDGILDSNEPNTVTASDGSYSLTDSLGIGGQVVSIGGVDTVTGLSIGTLTAPSGSSTVTPLTTLMQNLISSGAASSASQAQSLVASALGLNLSSINLTNYDPVTQLSGSSATQASLILSTGVMVQNVVAMITATLVGAGASESSALEAAFTALATAMDGASGRSFLQDASAISSIISDAASDSSLSGTIDASKVAAAQTAVAQTISSLSAAMETIISSGGSATALLEDLSAAARVAQRDAQADIAAAVADGTAETLSNTYSSSSIASLIAQAREEEVSTSGPIEGTSGNDSLTGTSGADDIQGNDGNDWLSGGAGNDRLYGGNGNDTLLGGSGNDLLNGGSGIDTADYGGSSAALTVNLATGSATSSEVGTDTLSSIEVVIGGSGNDSFTGGSGAETFFGGAGDDTFIASAGDDVLNGGDGTDTLDFGGVSAAVTVNLASGTASSTATGSDSLSSIEVVIGGSGNDSFIGGSGAETFFGGAGNDTFIASAGDDVLNGGDGTDTLDFSAVSAAVTVNLASGTASSTATGSDSLSSIEVVIGGSGNDSFTGGSGAETFFGGAGDDTFIASAGDDVLNGGDGTDTLDFSGVSAAVTVNLATSTASSTATGSDSLSSIEVVIGGSGNDSFTGGSGAETFFGGAGDDTFIASAGDDVLNGGDGTDTLDLSAVSAAVIVNLASGTASSTATGSDSLSSIEVVIGGSGNDSFTGGSGAETFFGGAGDDTFIASAGDDVLNGGDGTDTVDYGNTKVALTVNLANGTASSSESGSDSLSSIEKVIGGSGNDSLTGSSGADTLLGGDGSDTLIGNGGADVLSGGSGNDTLTYTGSEVSLDGGDGSDRLLLNAGSSVALGSLVGVVSTIEIIDLGNHETTLTVTADDVSSLIGGSDWFIVDGGSSDVLALSGEWLSGDIITVDGVTYDSYVQDGTLILVGQELTVEQIIPAVGEVLNVEGSSVLAGTYIHLGIGSDGYLGVGSGVVSETGWETASGGLSMAVDTDGFDQGDASATGDYFLPGTPVEGYSIGYVTTSGTTVLSAHYASSAAVNGSTSAEIDGTDLVATTTATSSDGALSISQVITLGSDATYYTTTVTLTNLTESTMSSIRYMRNADPDMDFDLHRTYLSVNDVLANPSESGVAAVQASGPVSGDHVLYFSDSSSARASANGFENTNPYADNVYGSPSDPNGSSDDIGINMVIDGGTLAPGASVTVSYVTSLNVATNGHDFLVGTSAANVLDGGNGNDILWGLGGADTLLGGNGSDTLIGGLGNDLLTGGNGPDTFLFTAGVGDTTAARIASLGTDVISDFTHGVDSLVLDGETFNLGEAFAYLEQGSSLSDAAVSFGTGSGVIVVGSDSGEGGVELWFTTDSSAATTSNSYQIATLQQADLSTVSQSDIHVG